MAVDLVARRLDRLEKTQREANDPLERIVTVLETHSRHFERMEEAVIRMSERIDRLVAAIARGRTQDLARFEDHDKRLRGLETKRSRKR